MKIKLFLFITICCGLASLIACEKVTTPEDEKREHLIQDLINAQIEVVTQNAIEDWGPKEQWTEEQTKIFESQLPGLKRLYRRDFDGFYSLPKYKKLVEDYRKRKNEID